MDGSTQGADRDWVFELEGTLVPVPGAVVLGAVGLGMIGWWKRRKSLAEDTDA